MVGFEICLLNQFTSSNTTLAGSEDFPQLHSDVRPLRRSKESRERSKRQSLEAAAME